MTTSPECTCSKPLTAAVTSGLEIGTFNIAKTMLSRDITIRHTVQRIDRYSLKMGQGVKRQITVMALSGTPTLTPTHAKAMETTQAGWYLQISKTIIFSRTKKRAVGGSDMIASIYLNQLI